MWLTPRAPFAVRNRGEDIWNAPLPTDARSSITTGEAFQQWEAVTGAGLNLWEWEQGRYPTRFMARVVAFHRLQGLIAAHQQEDARREAERKSKQKKRG